MSDGTIVGDFAVSASAASESIPSSFYQGYGDFSWTAPSGVKVVFVVFCDDLENSSASDLYDFMANNKELYSLVGVTPGKTYKLKSVIDRGAIEDEWGATYVARYEGNRFVKNWLSIETGSDIYEDGTEDIGCFLLWAPEINEFTPTVTDY